MSDREYEMNILKMKKIKCAIVLMNSRTGSEVGIKGE